MAERQQQPQQTAKTAEAPSEFDRLLQGSCSYRPFAEAQDIKISPALILKFLCRPTKNGAWPDQQQLMKFQVLCRSRQLNPFEGDAYLVGYDGRNGPEFSIITAIQALYKRAEANPNYDGIESGVIVKQPSGEIIQRQGDFMHPGDVLLGGWACVYRKDQSHSILERINLANRDKDYSVWQSDKGGMIVKCCEAGALRRAFPSQLSGLYVHDDKALMEASASDPQPARERAPAVDSVLGKTEALAGRLKQQTQARAQRQAPPEQAPDPETGEVPNEPAPAEPLEPDDTIPFGQPQADPGEPPEITQAEIDAIRAREEAEASGNLLGAQAPPSRPARRK